MILNNFHVIRPKYKKDQEEVFAWLAQMHSRSDPGSLALKQRLFQRFACDANSIKERGGEIPDYLMKPGEEDSQMLVYGKTGHGASIEERNMLFADIARKNFEDFYPSSASAPKHIIHVSCTGYVSPSAPQSIVDLRNWSGQTDVTHAYHMGCYAALPAVRIARGLSSVENQTIDIVHTEMPSLHLNLLDSSPEQIVVQSLFGDGNIKYSLDPSDSEAIPGLKVIQIKELIVPGTQKHMTWGLASWGMKMTLSRHVPDKIASSLLEFLGSFSETASNEEVIYAVHPGGPKIIDTVLDLLRLKERQIEHSRAVLRECGNMSSATLPHIWERIINDNRIQPGTTVISLAFGPGLTLFGMLAKKQ
jgi:predicted naringenin-chalcone synthase